MPLEDIFGNFSDKHFSPLPKPTQITNLPEARPLGKAPINSGGYLKLIFS